MNQYEQKAREVLGVKIDARPCDCINNKLGFWIVDGCQCSNSDDKMYAGMWCESENSVKEVAAALRDVSRSSTIHVVFDGPPSHESGRFVEVEDSEGHGISIGEWHERDGRFWELRIPGVLAQAPLEE